MLVKIIYSQQANNTELAWGQEQLYIKIHKKLRSCPSIYFHSDTFTLKLPMNSIFIFDNYDRKSILIL